MRLTGEAATKVCLVSDAADTVQRIGFIPCIEKGWLMVHEMGDELLRKRSQGSRERKEQGELVGSGINPDSDGPSHDTRPPQTIGF